MLLLWVNDKRKIIFEDPSSVVRTHLSYKELKKRWHDRAGNKIYKNWGMAVFGKKPTYNRLKSISMN